MIKIIIFDLDGLLIDSQPLQFKAYNQVFSKYGFPLTMKIWQEWIHNSYNTKAIIQKYHLPLDADIIRGEKKKIYDQLILDELTLKPGALNLINTLYGKFRLCVASSSRIESIELVLKKFDLRGKFETVFSDTEMTRGKPFPDIFLKTAEAMHAKPEECLVLEDSLAGLKAAKAARITCIICPDSFCAIDRSEFKGADKIVDSLQEVSCEMIKELS